jgi:hypothetical protein
MGAFVEGVFPFIHDATFFQDLLLPLIYYGSNIEYYVQWKVKSTTMPLEVRNTQSSI